jgi:hypothetical protein
MNTAVEGAQRTPAPEADDRKAASRHALGLDIGVGALVAAAYVLAQLWLLQGLRPWDSSLYFATAVDPGEATPSLFTLRIGLLAPVRAAVLVFGPSEAALYAGPLAFGVLLVTAAYGLTLALFRDRWLAAGAALLTVLAPSYLISSTFIFPDTAGTALFTAGFLFLVLGARRTNADERSWTPGVWAAIAGVFFGWSVLARDFLPILTPAVAGALVAFRYTWRRAALLAATTIATLGLDLLYCLIQFGDPLLHLRKLVVSRPGNPVTPADAPLVERFHDELQNIFDTAAVLPRLLLTWRTGWIAIVLILLFAVALVVLRDRRLIVLGLWVFNLWAFMAVIGLGSLPSGRWILNITNIRYWYPIFPPLVIGALGGGYLLAQRFLPRSRGLVLSLAAACVALLAAVPGVVEYRSCATKDVWASEPASRWHELRAWLSTPEAATYRVLTTDVITSRYGPVFTRTTFGDPVWSGHVLSFGPAVSGPIRRPDPTDLLLIDKDRYRRSTSFDRLRADWLPVFVSRDGAMVLLAHRSTLAAGTAPEDGAWWQVSDDLAKRRSATGCGSNPYRPPAPSIPS